MGTFLYPAEEPTEIATRRFFVVEHDVLLSDDLMDNFLVYGLDRWIVEAPGGPRIHGIRDDFGQPLHQLGLL